MLWWHHLFPNRNGIRIIQPLWPFWGICNANLYSKRNEGLCTISYQHAFSKRFATHHRLKHTYKYQKEGGSLYAMIFDVIRAFQNAFNTSSLKAYKPQRNDSHFARFAKVTSHRPRVPIDPSLRQLRHREKCEKDVNTRQCDAHTS